MMITTRRNFLIGSSASLLVASLPAYANNTLSLSGRAFGGSWKVLLANFIDTQTPARQITRVLAGIDNVFSPFKGDSEISRFNKTQTNDWQEASTSFARIASEALHIARLSGGAFDPSVGPDVAKYGFGPISGVRDGNFEGFVTHENAVRKHDATLTLDLCGIAKGHAVSAVADMLEGEGLSDFLIEIGGEVMARGSARDGNAWRIGIADPVSGGVYARIAANGMVFATSGDANNAYEVAGRRYSHTIDPATGEPVRNTIASVTVGAEQGATADALATALLVMGQERGMELAGKLDLPVLYLLRDGFGLKAFSNPQFDVLKRA